MQIAWMLFFLAERTAHRDCFYHAPTYFFLNNCVVLLSHLGEYAYQWAYKCNSAPICNDRKKLVRVRKHSRGVRTCED